MKEKWDERYGNSEYIYGIEPNNFLSEELAKLNPGRILMPGEGEGRNAVFAAKNGWEVDGFDYSEKAKEKAEKLASENSVKINYRVEDITELSLPPSTYDAAAIIFMHLDEKLREETHKKIIDSLKPGGVIILEVFEKEQLERNSGGPKSTNLLYSLEEIFTDFQDLQMLTFSKEIIRLQEGTHHDGEAVVIRYVGKKNILLK